MTALLHDLPDFADEIAKLCRHIYDQKEGVNHDPELLAQTAKTLSDAVFEGYGKDFISADWDTPDLEMLTRLTQNVFSFSAAKNYQELLTITDALRDENGKLRTFAGFKEQVAVINDKFNKAYLQTEYDTCIATATQSARWQGFKSEKGLFPFLRYQTAGDDSVRNEHRLLDGVTKRVDDPFWKTYYPPNGWNCRCEVVQVPEEDAQESKKGTYRTPTVPELFRTNCGETGLIFPQGHPYYHDVPNSEIRKAIAYLPPENAYLELKGGIIKQHVMHGVEELAGNLEVLNDLISIKPGITGADLLPDIHAKDNDLKDKFYPKKWQFHDKNKNADALVSFGKKEKWVVDIKRLQGNASHLSSHIAKAAKQADYAIIKLSEAEQPSIGRLGNIITRKLRETELKGVIIIDNDGRLYYEQYKNTTAG